jgi:adenylyltransferase/sulfurtransferase
MTDQESEFSSRYSRQVILAEIGDEGQRKLAGAKVVVVGVGATGSVSSALLVRAGVGTVRIIDRDVVELSNLQRQMLFTEMDAREGLPKALAAEKHLSSMNSDVVVEAVNDHLSPRNVDSLIGNVDVVVDGTDNMETRYLINDYCVKNSIPWVYGGGLGTQGMTMFIVPGEGPCFRCLFPESPGPGRLGTCETVGVLGSAPAAVASYQAMAAIRKIASKEMIGFGRLLTFDLWRDDFSVITVGREPACATCGKGEFAYLDEEVKTAVVTTCGEGTYQVYPPTARSVNLAERAGVLEGKGEVEIKSHYITFRVGSRSMNIFSDGRAQLKGMNSPSEALSFYTKYLGM